MSSSLAVNAEVVPEKIGTFEEHEKAWKSAYGEMEDSAWRLAEISASLVGHFGAEAVEQFARQRGVTGSWIYQLSRAHVLRQTLPEDVRTMRTLPNGRPITISHYVESTNSPEPQRMMRQVIEESLSTTALRKRVADEKKRAVRSLPGGVKELPEAEKRESSSLIVRKSNNETGTMSNAGVHECEHCHSPLVRMPNLGKVMDELSLDIETLRDESGVSAFVIEDLISGEEVSHPVATPLVEVIRERRAERERRREAMGL